MYEKVKSLWNSSEADRATGGVSSEPWECRGISIDTRTLERGDLFVALKGEAGDGHAFLKEAAAKGAAAAIVSSQESESHVLPLLRVDNTLAALEKLGIAARERCLAKRIAVTGSVGKTSTKDALKWILKDQGLTHGSVASYNNHWGVPLTLARMPQETQFAVFEVGMQRAGEILPLSHMIKPEIGIVTSIVEAHLQFFRSLEEIALAKAEIFEGMDPGGSVILNRESAFYDLLAQLADKKGLKVYGAGRDEGSHFRLISFVCDAEHSSVVASIGGQILSYTIAVPGIHWVTNSLAVLGAASLAGADVEKAAKGLETIVAPSGRGQRFKGNYTVIDESYNANPTSMRAALAVLGQSQGRRKIAVIGDMREIGDLARKRHEELIEPLLAHKIDLVFCCGPNMAHLFALLPDHMKGAYTETSIDLIPHVLETVTSGDVISIKASLGTRVKPIVEALLVKDGL
jgi:UDP-N-acetylmuramoyl-tripeptide--D-alanyl-D-alanine ligase